MTYRIELFDNKQHEVGGFECGTEILNIYLKQRASQESRKKVAAVYILHKTRELKVIGYYTLSSTSIKTISLPEIIRKKLPKYNVLPAVLLGRLAVDVQHQRKGIGEYLLLDALKRAYNLSKHIGSFAVVVDSKNEESRKFYEKYGFVRLTKQPFKLYLPMGTIKEVLNE